MSKLDIENAPDEIKAELDRMRAPLPKMTYPRDSLESVIADLRTYAQAIRTSPTCSCNECDLCAWIAWIAIDPDTFADRLTALQAGAGDGAYNIRFLSPYCMEYQYYKVSAAKSSQDAVDIFLKEFSTMKIVSVTREMTDWKQAQATEGK